MILKTKSCPKCRGDIYIDEDIYGWYEECFQCGYLRFLEKLKGTGKFIPAGVINTRACLDNGNINNEERRETASLIL